MKVYVIIKKDEFNHISTYPYCFKNKKDADNVRKDLFDPYYKEIRVEELDLK